MGDLLGWILILGICFGSYVMVRLSALSAEIDRLKAHVARLAGREQGPALQSLAEALDARQGYGPPRPAEQAGAAGQPQPVPEFIVDSPPPVAAPPIIATPPLSRPQPASQPVRPAAARATTARHQPAQPFDIESVVGGNWMAKLGIAAIAVSVAFFLQYAFRSGWIKPWGQVGVGLVGAVAMMGAGQLFLTKERFRSYAQVLFSGGIVVYFLSIYAAYTFYHPALMGFWPAFGALAVGAIAASALALANGTEAVAVICILGAFAAPALIRDQAGPPSGDGLIRLYLYLAAINLWAAVFVRLRAWHSVAITSFMCTWLLFLAAGPVAHGGWRVETFAALFLLSAVWTGVRALYADGGGSLRNAGFAVVFAGCLVFLIASAAILSDSRSFGFPDLALMGSGVGLLLAALALTVPESAEERESIRKGFGVLSALASGSVIAFAFLSAPPVPRAEAGGALVFATLNYAVFVAMALRLNRQKGGSHTAALHAGVNAAVYVFVVLHVLAGTTFADVPAASLWLPAAGLATLAAVRLSAGEDSPLALPCTLCLAVHGFTLAALARAVWSDTISFTAHWPAEAAWILSVEFLLTSGAWLALRKRIAWPDAPMDVAGALLGSPLFFAMMAWALGGGKTHGISLLALWSFAAACWHGFIGGIALAGEEENDLLRYAHLGLAVAFLTIAIPLQLDLAWVAVAWAAEGAALVWAGCRAKSATARRFGYAVLAIAAGRALSVDLLRPLAPFRFLLNDRMLAGAAVAAACGVSAWLLTGNRNDLDRSESELPATLSVAANIFVVLFVSIDLWQRFGQPAGGELAGHFALTLFWSLYAVGAAALGSALESRPVRALGACLVALAAAKAITADVFLDVPAFHFLLNLRLLAGASVVAAAYATAALLARANDEPAGEPNARMAAAALLVIANLWTLAFVSRDLWQQFGAEASGVVSAQQLALSIFWALYGLVAICVGIWMRKKPVRVCAMALLCVAMCKAFLWDVRQLEVPYRVASFLVLGVVFLLVSYLYTRFEERMHDDGTQSGPHAPPTTPAPA